MYCLIKLPSGLTVQLPGLCLRIYFGEPKCVVCIDIAYPTKFLLVHQNYFYRTTCLRQNIPKQFKGQGGLDRRSWGDFRFWSKFPYEWNILNLICFDYFNPAKTSNVVIIQVISFIEFKSHLGMLARNSSDNLF